MSAAVLDTSPSVPAAATSRLDVTGLHLQPKDRSLVGQDLRTHKQFTLSAQSGRAERRLEDYIVHALIDFDDIDYTVHASLLYDLAGQMVRHLQSYLSDPEEVRNVLDLDRVLIAKNIHAQMAAHFYESSSGYEVVVSRGELIEIGAGGGSIATIDSMRQIRVGQPVTLTADMYGGKVQFNGKVAGLGIATGAASALLPAQNATGNWVKVVQRLPVRLALLQWLILSRPLPLRLPKPRPHPPLAAVVGVF